MRDLRLPPRPISTGAALVLCAAALAAPLLSAPAAPPREEVQGEVSVREVEIGVALPEDLSPFKVRVLETGDFLVVREGKSQQVVRAERVQAKDRAWTQVVWVDRVLASPQTVYDTMKSLAEQSVDLARMGTVDVVVADPAPRVDLAGGTETPAVHRALEDAAAAAAPARGAHGAGAWSAPDAAALRRQSDRIVAWIASRKAVGPRTFWLPVDGIALSLPALTALGVEQAPDARDAAAHAADSGGAAAPAADSGGAAAHAADSGRAAATAGPHAAESLTVEEGERVRVLVDLERTLAAYGWTTLVLIDRPAAGAGGAPDVNSDYDRWHRNLPDHGRPGSTSTPLSLRFPPRSGTSDFDPRTLDALLDPQFAAPRLLAEETGGWLLGGPWDYAPTFDALARRWRVWIRAAEAEEGELQTVAVTLRQGPALRASRWLRSATPVAVVESRLRAALESERQPAVATLAARITAEAGGSALLEAAPGSSLPAATAWRWRVAFQNADGSVQIQPVTAELRDGAWRARLHVPTGTRRLAVSRDDPRGEAFGIAVLKPPAE